MPALIAGFLVFVAIFSLGRASAPDAEQVKVYRDMPRTVTEVVTVTKPAPLPSSCVDVVDALTNVQFGNAEIIDALENLDKLNRDLGVKHGRDQAVYNAWKQQFDKQVLQLAGRANQTVTYAQRTYDKRMLLCANDVKAGKP